MFRFIAFVLVIFVLLPCVMYATQKKPLTDEQLLKNAHQMVRLWWTTWITFGTIRAHRNLVIWRLECTRLMKKLGK